MTIEEAYKKQGIIVSITIARVLEELDRMVDRLDRLNERVHRGNTAMAGKDTELECEIPEETSVIGT